MIISRIIRRSIWSVSFPLHKKPLDSTGCNRLLYKEQESFSITKNKRMFQTYEGDGKTVGFIINKKDSDVLLINSFMREGFVLSNGFELLGPIVVFPHTILSWNVTTAQDVNEDSLVLFKLMEPKVDILVFGFGCHDDYTAEVKERFTKTCKNLGIRFEALPTEHAVGTYNFLAEDRRLVAGALIPPRKIDKLRLNRTLTLVDQLEDDLEEEDLPAIEAKPPVKLIK